MLDKKIILFLFLTAAIANCTEKMKPDEKDLKQTASQILSNKIYNVKKRKSDTDLENIVIYQSLNKLYQLICHKEKDSFITDRLLEIGEDLQFIKHLFLNPETGISHSVLIVKNKTDHLIVISDSERLFQKIKISEADLKKLYMKKNENKPFDEVLYISDKMYRFDSFSYVEVFHDTPLPFLTKFNIAGENSEILMHNRGGYTSRTVITFSFPDLNRKNYEEFIKLTKDIPTVKMYLPGSKIYHSSRKYISPSWPMIEITKEPFGSGLKMRLPLFMSGKIGRVHVRAIISIRGGIERWPSDSQLGSDENVTLDQQGYPAYIYKANE